MNYTLFSERYISSLDLLLNDANFKTKKMDDYSLEVAVNDKTKDTFVKLLAIYYSVVYYKDYYKMYLNKKLSTIEDVVIDKIASIDIESNENKFYIIQNLRILLLEYLKNNQTLALDGFLIFNAPGFSKDIRFLAEMYCDSCDDSLGDLFMNKIAQDSSASTSIEPYLEDITDFEQSIQDTRLTFPLSDEIKNIKRLDLLKIDNKFMFLADEVNKFAVSDLKDLLSVDKLGDSFDDISAIYLIVGTVALLDIDKLVIHKNLPKNSFDFILKNLLKLKDFGVLSNTNIFKCKGSSCSKCNLT